MKELMNDQELEQVVGGTVVVSADKMKIGFTTLKEKYSLKNCTFDQAMAVIYSMYGQYTTHGDDYDAAVRDEFKSRGWI